MLKLTFKCNIIQSGWKYNLVFRFEFALFDVTNSVTEQGETL